MANEKMMILNMLHEGKITAEEAANLLSSVEDTAPAKSRNATSSDASNNRHSRPAPSSAAGAGGIDFDAIGRKFAAFAKDLEPKVQKVAETVAETTVNLAGRLSKSIESAHTPRVDAGGSAKVGQDKQIELTVSEGYNELNLTGLNAAVLIKGYNGDKISAKINYKANRSGANIDLIKLGSKYYLNYEEDDFSFVAIDAYVPSHMFRIISISGLNGNMDLSALNCDDLQISNTNGQLTLSDLTANTIKSESGNGHLRLSQITAQQAVLDHFNGAVDSMELDIEKLSLTNFNGTMTVSTSGVNRFSDYLWNIETSNAKLTLNMPTLPDLGYHIKAHTTLGKIKIGLTGLEYSINDPSLVEARTASFDTKGKKIRLALETSNAPLTVN